MTIQKFEVPDWIRSVLICDPTDIWGNVVGMGLSELAVRAGFPGGFDERGRVIFFDDFSEGRMKFVGTGSGTGADTALSTTSSHDSALSLALIAGSDNERWTDATYYLPYPTLGKVGLQASFTVHGFTEYLTFSLGIYDGTKQHQGSVRYNKGATKIEYLDSTFNWQDLITSVNLYANSKNYHTLKLVLDLENDKYHRVLVDNWSWLTGDKALYTPNSATSKRAYAGVTHYGAAGYNAVSYLSSVVFTQNEPS